MPPVVEERLKTLDDLTLDHGGHSELRGGPLLQRGSRVARRREALRLTEVREPGPALVHHAAERRAGRTISASS
jgi:hypothetical protein